MTLRRHGHGRPPGQQRHGRTEFVGQPGALAGKHGVVQGAGQVSNRDDQHREHQQCGHSASLSRNRDERHGKGRQGQSDSDCQKLRAERQPRRKQRNAVLAKRFHARGGRVLDIAQVGDLPDVLLVIPGQRPCRDAGGERDQKPPAGASPSARVEEQGGRHCNRRHDAHDTNGAGDGRQARAHPQVAARSIAIGADEAHECPGLDGHQRHVGHERERQHEKRRKHRQGGRPETGAAFGGASLAEKAVHAGKGDARQDPRRHPQRREREAERQAEQGAPQDLCVDHVGREVENLETLVREQVLDRPGIDPVVDEGNGLEWLHRQCRCAPAGENGEEAAADHCWCHDPTAAHRCQPVGPGRDQRRKSLCHERAVAQASLRSRQADNAREFPGKRHAGTGEKATRDSRTATSRLTRCRSASGKRPMASS